MIVSASSVRNAVAGARKALGTTAAVKTRSGGEDGSYRVTFTTGQVVEVQIKLNQPTVIVER